MNNWLFPMIVPQATQICPLPGPPETLWMTLRASPPLARSSRISAHGVEQFKVGETVVRRAEESRRTRNDSQAPRTQTPPSSILWSV
jgi:hypothetical protein